MPGSIMPTDLPDDWIPILVVSVTAIAGVLGAAFAFLAAWLKLRSDHRALQAQIAKDGASLALALDKAIDERVAGSLKDAWEEIDKLRDAGRTHGLQMGAVARILRAIARQWPKDDQGPNLDPVDIALIEETIPAHWIRPTRSTDT